MAMGQEKLGKKAGSRWRMSNYQPIRVENGMVSDTRPMAGESHRYSQKHIRDSRDMSMTVNCCSE
jgi:hypothetical protein